MKAREEAGYGRDIMLRTAVAGHAMNDAKAECHVREMGICIGGGAVYHHDHWVLAFGPKAPGAHCIEQSLVRNQRSEANRLCH